MSQFGPNAYKEVYSLQYFQSSVSGTWGNEKLLHMNITLYLAYK